MSDASVKRANVAERAAVLAQYIKDHPDAGITARHVRTLYRRKDLGEFSLTTTARDLDQLCHTAESGVIGRSINGSAMRYYTVEGMPTLSSKSPPAEWQAAQ